MNLRNIDQFLVRDLWVIDLSTVSSWKRWWLRALRLGLAVGWEFRHRLLDARAAGLVYTTLLSLVPFVAVIVSVLKAFGVHERVEPILAQVVDPLGPGGQQITASVTQFVNNLDVGVLGVLGIGGLLYTTYSMIDKVEDTFNAIWRVRSGRSWTRKFTDYLSVVLVGPVVIVTAFGLLASIQSHSLVQSVMDIQPLGYVAVWGAKYIPYILLGGVFTFFYKFLPHTDVRTPAALVGGGSAALLWGAAGEAFAFFVSSSSRYSAIYSGFAVLILFLLWLYVGWLIILLGAQVAFFYQHPRTYELQYPGMYGVQAWRERVGLQMLACLARRYLAGEGPAQVEEIAGESNVPTPTVEELADLFVEAGYLSRLSDPKGLGFTKPPSTIALEDVIRVIHQGGSSGRPAMVDTPDPVGSVLRRRDAAVAQALTDFTVETLANTTGRESRAAREDHGESPAHQAT